MMRTLLVFLFIGNLLPDLHSQMPACPPNCRKISLDAFAPGMTFYFPPREHGSLDVLVATRINGPSSYHRLAGEKYIIKDTTHFTNKLYYNRLGPDTTQRHLLNDRVQQTYLLTMKNVNISRDQFVYAISVDSAALLSAPPYPALENNVNIAGAIAWDEFETTRTWLLQLPATYALFDIGGKKYERVKIVDVLPGSWETPLGIIYTSDSGNGRVNVNVCGTNVPDTYTSHFHFSKYFTCDNPQGKVNDSRWALIRSGKPAADMTVEEIVLTLGKPKQVEETVEKGVTKTVYTFEKYAISFEAGVIVKMVSVSTN